MTDTQTADRQARYRVRQKYAALAHDAGAEVIDTALVSRSRDGHYVIALYDGPALHLIPRDSPDDLSAKLDRVLALLEGSSGSQPNGSRGESIKDAVSGPGESPKRPKKIRVPTTLSGTGNPGMARAQWEIIVSQMAAGKVSDDDFPGAVARAFTTIAEEVDEEIDKDKSVKQLTAMRDALIEQHGEQWRHHLPEWPEEW